MTNYDFNSLLSPLDFEFLVRDLLTAELKIDLTNFAEGKDEGIDLRYSKNEKVSTIVQCKRVRNISKESILSELKKIEKLNCLKYYFVISQDLSPTKFDFIKTTFKKWMKDDSYIITKSKLNKLLEKYPDIHRKHFKLWLNSANIFNDIINRPLFERAKHLISDLRNDYKYFVKNESLNKAYQILNDNQFIIISGIPGIGKTTLAKIIIWEYLQKDYEIIEIHKVSEGEQILIEDSEKKQVYYYDDFLGENFLKYDVIEGRSNDLVNFINRIKNSSNKILIMTTREYILNQAQEAYEKLGSLNLDVAKQTLDLSSYSKKIKAQILYNHLFYSDLPIDYIIALIETKTYKKIIKHKNYSPRIIEHLTKKLYKISPRDYSTEFLDNLDKPFGIWDKAFNNQISEGSKYTLYLLLSISYPILLSDFKKVLICYYEKIAKNSKIEFNPYNFKNYLRELENSFIKINITDKNHHYVDFLNPSIKDFLLSIVKYDTDIILSLIKSSLFFKQFIYTIRYLAEEKLSEKEILKSINKKIISEFEKLKNHVNINYDSNENKYEISPIQRINDLKFYLKKVKTKKIHQFIIEEFKKIDLEGLIFTAEKLYVEFYIDYYDILEIDYLHVLEKIRKNIRWYDSVENLSLLKDVDNVKFDEFVKKNKKELNISILNSIKKEIEYHNEDIDTLKYLQKSIIESKLLELYSISYERFNEFFEEKFNELSENSESNNDDKIDIETDNNLIVDDFDEDDFFKIEMFERT